MEEKFWKELWDILKELEDEYLWHSCYILEKKEFKKIKKSIDKKSIV